MGNVALAHYSRPTCSCCKFAAGCASLAVCLAQSGSGGGALSPQTPAKPQPTTAARSAPAVGIDLGPGSASAVLLRPFLHPGPLVVLGYHHGRYHVDFPSEGIACDLMDLSGRVVKRVRRADVEWPMSVQLDLVCVARGTKERYGLLDPATGDVRALPGGFAKGHAARSMIGYRTAIVFGRVTSTGEIKVLRLLDNSDDTDFVQLCEIVTLSNGGDHGQWRRKKSPPELLVVEDPYQSVVIDGVCYFVISARIHCCIRPRDRRVEAASPRTPKQPLGC
ncbi:hypothetical protein ACP4OV_024534 [Aristida adscensionis]